MKFRGGLLIAMVALVILSACSSGEYQFNKRTACVIHRDPGGTTYERVNIVGEADEAHWEVVFPDSSSREIRIVSKSTISFIGCPFSISGPGLPFDSFRPAEFR